MASNKKNLKQKIITPTTRDDFTLNTIETLKKRAAFICSNPECRNMCVAPSETDEKKIMYIGKASHICAASVGGPRFDSNMTTEKRKDIKNAIFLCGGCATMIDNNNGIDFTKEVLYEWKITHDAWIRSNLNKSIKNDIDAIPLEVEFNQKVGGIGNNPVQINISGNGTANVNTKSFNPTVSSQEETLNQPRVSSLNSGQSFICSEIQKFFQTKGEIFDPRDDYNRALCLLSLGDSRNFATLIFRIYYRVELHLQSAQFLKDQQQSLFDFDTGLKQMESLHNGEIVSQDVNIILTGIEKSIRDLFLILKI